MPQNTVVVADRHAVTRAGVTLWLSQAKFKVAGETDNGRDLVKLVDELKPTVAIFDTDLPKLTGRQACHRITSGDSGTRTLFLTGAEDDRTIEDIYSVGAHGIVFKSSPCATIIPAVKAVASGETWFERRAQEIVATNRHMPGWASPHSRLTDREIEIVQLVAEKMTDKMIGADLGISERTVEVHVMRIYKKLGARSRIDIFKYALDSGMVKI